ncbi:potassium voltage-gated channel subfamily A member 1 [Platysternon megacephalum]|uniref:peptidylprolyl isomerase n=1 Tax=Platysternon megacephalum TaxID=55544 RepID=A0A4D9DY47_9SAUR|nr:potassium voltage-gated channel subfamily A member 1 [Platysternon megacephalum]
MFGAAEEDDADFLSPTGGARLASLFGLDQTVSVHGNEFFQYTAPKQPKKGQAAATGQPAQKMPTTTAASAAPSVFVAAAVHAFRYTNGQYVKQGKYGAAVVGNHATKEYKILLYINQQQQVTVARIHPGFVLTVQPNNYSTFYDDQRHNWSIMFESEKAAMDFSKQLCIAKCNSSPSLDSVLYQDLIVGEGQGLEVGDSLEVAYTSWLFQNNGLGQVFDSNVNKDKLLRLKLGSGKVIKGWEEGMIGMKKGGRRLLIIPPAWAYGSQGVASHIPPDSTLVFEVEVKRVKLVKESGSDGQSIGSRDSSASSPVPNSDSFSADPVGLPPLTIPPKPGEPAVRAKSNSISEQLANPDVAKAKLISRMAKMGQPMLPFLAGTAGTQLDSSDSEIEVKVAEELAAATAQVSRLQLELTAHQKKEMDLHTQLTTALQEAEMNEAQLNKLQAQLAELQESSEDTQAKFRAEKQSRRQLDLKVTALEEELADLKVERENLEKNLVERKKKSLLERSQAEEEMDEIRRSYQEELDKLRQLLKKARTSTDRSAAEQQSLIQAELESQWEAKCERMLVSAKEQHLRQYQEVCEQRDSQQQHITQLEEKYSALQSHVAALKARYEERIRELEKGSVLENQERSPPTDSTEEVKKIMNGVFQTLRGEFELEESYSGRTVLGVVMNTIKTVTLQLLSRQQERRESNSDEEEKEELRTGERKQESPPKAKEDHESAVQYGPAPSIVCPTKPAGESAGIATPPRSPEEGQRTQNTTASEVKMIQEMHEAHTFSESVQPVKPNQGLVDPEEDVDSVLAEQRQASAPSGLAQHDGSSQKIASVQAETPEPSILDTKLGAMEEAMPSEMPATEHKAEEPAGGLEPLPLKSAEGGSCLGIPDAPRFEMGTSISDLTSEMAEKDPATNHETTEPQGPASSPKQKNSSLTKNDDDLFQVATHKPLKPGVPPEEEDEEEVSMKGHPPPTPLFGDDDDDDDLDWLG